MSCRASLIIITLSLGVACSESTPSLPSEEVQVLRDRGASSPTAYQARDMDSTIPPELDDLGLGSTPHDMGIFEGGESMSDVDPLPPAGSDDPLPLRAPSNGTLSIRYANDYLLDNYQSRDPDYLNMHRRSVQNNPAFFGELVDRNLPVGDHLEVRLRIDRHPRVIKIRERFVWIWGPEQRTCVTTFDALPQHLKVSLQTDGHTRF